MAGGRDGCLVQPHSGSFERCRLAAQETRCHRLDRAHDDQAPLPGNAGPQYGPRVMSENAAKQAQNMLRRVVTDGTASFVDNSQNLEKGNL